MKHIRLPLSLLLALSILPSCKPASDSAAEESRRLLEQAQVDNARQAAELQQRSDDLQQQLTDLQKALQEKETAELKARLESIRQENERLAADAQVARQKSLSLAEELERSKPPRALPYVPPSAPAAPQQPWTTPDDDYSLFYDSLRPHGKWVEVDGYGYAFRPGQAERPGWRPYVDGRWAWTDQGWAWDSNEPFGWACYHYGRWVQVSRHGWLWVPGREWAPAWVSWRYGDDCVGWAPLPPGTGRTAVGHDCDLQYGLGPSSYTFINATHFSRTSYLNVSLSITSITRIFQNTLNVTSLVPSTRGSIFTQRGGPALDWVEKRCGSPVMRAPVSFRDRLDRAPDFRRGREHGHPGFHAAPLEIVRGKSKPGIPPIAERIQQPVMLDSWKDVPADRLAALKEAMLREAKLPQPRPALPDTPRPAQPTLPKQSGDSSPDTPVAGTPGQPRHPGGGMPQVDESRVTPGDSGRRPGLPAVEKDGRSPHEHGMNPPQAPKPGRIVQQGRPQEPGRKPGVEQPTLPPNSGRVPPEDAAMKARVQEAARLQQELAHRQAVMEAQRAQAAEQEKQNQERRQEMQSRMERQRQDMEKSRQEKLNEEARSREVQFRRHQEERAAKQAEIEAEKRRNEAAMAAQQQEAAQLEQRQAEAMKAREDIAKREAEMQEQRGRDAEMRTRQEAGERQQKMEQQRQMQETAERQREAAERAQREAMEKAQQEAAMRAAQVAAERQREAAERAQREAMEKAQQEAAMRAAQEAAERQREAAERAQRETMEKAQQEAAMRAAQEAAERQREAAERAQREAMERAQREAAERQREMQRQQQEEARRQAEEAARRQAEEAARRAAEEAGKQQGQ